MPRSLVDIISSAPVEWINGTRVDRTADGRWQVSAPSRFSKSARSVEINEDLCIALRDAWGPYAEEPVLSAAEMEE